MTEENIDSTAMALEFYESTRALILAVRSLQTQVKGPLTSSQLAVISPLQNGHAMSIGDLASTAGVTQPNVSRMIPALEARGLLQRATNAGVTSITITQQGREEVEETRRQLLNLHQLAIAKFSQQRQLRIMEALNELSQAIIDSSENPNATNNQP